MAIIADMRRLSDVLLSKLSQTVEAVWQFIPNLIVATLGIILAWIVAKIIERFLSLVLESIKLDELLARGRVDNKALDAAGVGASPTRMIAVLGFWTTFFFVGLAPAADLLQLKAGRLLMERLIGYIPEVLGAGMILAAAFFIGGLLREVIAGVIAVAGLGYARESGWLVYLLVVVIGFGLALSALGLDRPLILAVAAVLSVASVSTLAIGFAFGARDLFGAIVAGRELRGRLAIGDDIIIGDYTGKIERLSLAAVFLRTVEGTVSVPNHIFIQTAIVKKSEQVNKAA